MKPRDFTELTRISFRASRNCFNSAAALPPKPGTSAICSSVAVFNRCTEPNFFSNAALRASPMPGNSSSTLSEIRLMPQLRVVAVRHAMAFVANPLEQFHRRMIQPQPQRLAFARLINFLKLLRQPDDGNLFKAELLQFRARRVQWPLPPSIRMRSGKIRRTVGGTATAGCFH